MSLLRPGIIKQHKPNQTYIIMLHCNITEYRPIISKIRKITMSLIVFALLLEFSTHHALLLMPVFSNERTFIVQSDTIVDQSVPGRIGLVKP